jgi:very-short-patch-repair endonuclease
MLTEETFDLLKNTYNFRNRYIADASTNIKIVSPFAMCIENQTIGFIANAFEGVVETIRQNRIGVYKTDLYFPAYRLAVECDEHGHNDRDPHYEATRENYIVSAGNTVIRFNPNAPGFDMSFVLRDINRIILMGRPVAPA